MRKILEKPTPSPPPQKVLLLRGGWSRERDVSLQSGASVEKALKTIGHHVEVFDPPRNAFAIAEAIHKAFQGHGPDVIFNILHGFEVEDGVIQGVLELSGVPYTFSGVLSSALTMNKHVTRTLVSHAGVRIPKGFVFAPKAPPKQESLPLFPFILKPLQEGSSFGVSLIEDIKKFQDALENWSYGPFALVEEYIRGQHLFVSVFGQNAVGILEVNFNRPFFDYEAKYTPGCAIHRLPEGLSQDVIENAYRFAEKAQHALQCEGISRADFIYGKPVGETDALYFLEHNTQPGLTNISLVPDTMKHQGWTYEDVIQWALENPRRP